jgi:hypothetical protein
MMHATMDRTRHIPDRHLGTTLGLCGGTRCVRVLTLPTTCGRRSLRHVWDECFGDEAAPAIPWADLIAPLDLQRN